MKICGYDIDNKTLVINGVMAAGTVLLFSLATYGYAKNHCDAHSVSDAFSNLPKPDEFSCGLPSRRTLTFLPRQLPLRTMIFVWQVIEMEYI